jgi:hypothetical protein
MRLWEITGWFLLGTGLFVFFRCYQMLMGDPPREQPRIFESAALMVMGIFIFRGGIHLLKIAAAARVCRGMSEVMLVPTDVKPRPRKTGFGPRAA